MTQPPVQPTIGELVGTLTSKLSDLIRGEVDLIKAQAAEKGKRFGVAAGMFVGAGLFGFLALCVLIAAAVLGIAEALPAWLAALIVAVALLALAGVLALIGKMQIDKASETHIDPKGALEQDVAAIKEGLK